MKISQLTYELESQEKEFEKKLRTMRQEQERIKERYASVQGKSEEAKQAQLLEEELQKTKTYYTKRIRELEDKYKYGMGKAPAAPKSNRSQQSTAKPEQSNDQVNELRDMNERLVKERNLLAQKVVVLESQNNVRRQSIPGASPNQDMKNVFYNPDTSLSSSPSPVKPPK